MENVTIPYTQLLAIEKHMAESNIRLKNIEDGQKDFKTEVKGEIKNVWDKMDSIQNDFKTEVKAMNERITDHPENCTIKQEVKDELEIRAKTPDPDMRSVKRQQNLQWGFILTTMGLFSGFAAFLWQEITKKLGAGPN